MWHDTQYFRARYNYTITHAMNHDMTITRCYEMNIFSERKHLFLNAERETKTWDNLLNILITYKWFEFILLPLCCTCTDAMQLWFEKKKFDRSNQKVLTWKEISCLEKLQTCTNQPQTCSRASCLLPVLACNLILLVTKQNLWSWDIRG